MYFCTHALPQVLDLKASELEKALLTNNEAEEMHVRVSMAELELDLSHPATARIMYLRSLDLAVQLSDRVAELAARMGLANACCGIRKYDEALSNYKQAIVIAQPQAERRLLAAAHLGKGKCHVALKLADQGIQDMLTGEHCIIMN